MASINSCPQCNQSFKIARLCCPNCNVTVEGQIELPTLAQLSLEDQAFVMAFVRHHGSIKKMESLFGISYPTVKNRLNAIAAALDKTMQAPSPRAYVLEQLARGHITVEEALDKLG
jgi:hypothetical protein